MFSLFKKKITTRNLAVCLLAFVRGSKVFDQEEIDGLNNFPSEIKLDRQLVQREIICLRAFVADLSITVNISDTTVKNDALASYYFHLKKMVEEGKFGNINHDVFSKSLSAYKKAITKTEKNGPGWAIGKTCVELYGGGKDASAVTRCAISFGSCFKVMSDFIKNRRIIIERGQPHYSETDVDKYYNHGYTSMEKGKYDRAIDDFTMALLIDPCCAKAYYHRGRALSIKSNLELALNDAKEANNLKPDRQEYIQFVKDLDLQILCHSLREKSDTYTDDEKKMIEGYLLKHDEKYKNFIELKKEFESIVYPVPSTILDPIPEDQKLKKLLLKDVSEMSIEELKIIINYKKNFNEIGMITKDKRDHHHFKEDKEL